VLQARPARRNYDRSSANSNFLIRFDALYSTVCTYMNLVQFSTGDIPSLLLKEIAIIGRRLALEGPTSVACLHRHRLWGLDCQIINVKLKQSI
jgi:hypothetical protein